MYVQRSASTDSEEVESESIEKVVVDIKMINMVKFNLEPDSIY